MGFDIDKYLDSLPDDTTHINVSSKKLTYLPQDKLKRFKNLRVLLCDDNELTELPEFNENLINI